MAITPVPPKTKPNENVTRMGLSLYPEDRRIAEALAERHHGGNVARLVRTLLRDAWNKEGQKAA